MRQILIKCDGNCNRTIDSLVHDGGWFELTKGDIFGRDRINERKPPQTKKHFCSYYCILEYICRELNINITTDPSISRFNKDRKDFVINNQHITPINLTECDFK